MRTRRSGISTCCFIRRCVYLRRHIFCSAHLRYHEKFMSPVLLFAGPRCLCHRFCAPIRRAVLCSLDFWTSVGWQLSLLGTRNDRQDILDA
jgi:hypothetical protein